MTRFGADDTLDVGADVLVSAAARAANADSRKQMREDGSAVLSKVANSKPVTVANEKFDKLLDFIEANVDKDKIQQQDDFMTGFRGEDLQHSGKADFYVSPSGEVLPGEYESWIGENQRSTILSQIEDPTLKSVVGQMYPKNSVIGTGSLPELIRFSEENGLNLVRESRYMLAKTLSDYLTQATHSGMVSLSDKNVLDMIMTSWK